MLPKLARQRTSLQKAGFNVGIETPLGIPFIEINELARVRSASLIVVRSLGKSLIGDLLRGSTGHSILQKAVVPVLLVRSEIATRNGGKRCLSVCADFFKHILFPTDFSDTAERAFLYLEHIVRETNSEVTLLHVQDRSKTERHLTHRLEEFNQAGTERLEGMKLRLEQCGAGSVPIEVPYGSPATIILERARSKAFSLILMGSQGRGFINEVFMGSVSNHIARCAPLPVLFVPACFRG
jgi:nucleotide-binding universal stress UspA family protein